MTLVANERIDDGEEAARVMLEGWQAALHTACPGIVETVNADGTLNIQPAITAAIRAQDGSVSQKPLPLLTNVLVAWQGGGGFTATFPIKAGDECLVVFGSRCIDAWWELGGIQAPMDPRMHSLSDSFALVGVRSRPRALPNISTTGAQLRSDDGSTYVEVDQGSIEIVAPAGVMITSPSVATTGNLLAGTGASGTFRSASGEAITVQDGIITNIE